MMMLFYMQSFFNLYFREWNRQAYDENGNIRKDASLIKAIVRVFGFKYMLLAIPSILAVSTIFASSYLAKLQFTLLGKL